MTGDASKFVSITLKQEGHVTYGDNNKGKILSKGTIGNENNFLIHDVLYVEGLKHNLLNIINSVTEATKSPSELILVRSGCQIQRKFYLFVRDQTMSICLTFLTLHLLVVS